VDRTGKLGNVSNQPSDGPRGDSAPRADELVAVQSSGFLARLSPERAADLVRSAPVVRYPAGNVIAAARAVDWAAIIVSGVVRQYLPTANGRQVTIRYARVADLVGRSSAGSTPAGVEIEAVETADLLHLDVVHLERTARLDPVLSMALVGELSSRLSEAYRTLADNTFATVRARVARDLLERSFARPRVQVRVTQQALADATGSVREVVTRALRELRLQGLIETDQSWITILDLDGLIREARHDE
jgi:CRP/FNR family transcriptional regulator, cyclic AMP receptor protein